MKIRTAILFSIFTILLGLGFPAAAEGPTKRIRFAKGKSSATVSGAVVRGDRNTYLVGAKAEQLMTVRITSRENNAVFQVMGPDGEYLQDAGEEDDAKQVTNILPYSGDYRIVVGPTRGNATYRLTMSIE